MTVAYTRAQPSPAGRDSTSLPNRSITAPITDSSTSSVIETGSPAYMPNARLSSSHGSNVAMRSFLAAGSSSTSMRSMRSTR